MMTSRAGLIGRWWNGRFGRIARRDIWLVQTVTWQVMYRIGDAETGKAGSSDHETEDAARAAVDDLIASGGDGWRELTSLFKPQSERP